MITIIILGILCAIYFIIQAYKDELYCKSDKIFMCIMYAIIGALMGGIIGLIISSILPVKTEIVKTTYNIVALKDKDGFEGSFYLGSGNIEGKMKYVFYYENNGAYSIKQIDCDNAKIKYSEGNTKVELFTKERVKTAIINYFSMPFIEDKEKEYIIYVPNGTIKQDYELDLQ